MKYLNRVVSCIKKHSVLLSKNPKYMNAVENVPSCEGGTEVASITRAIIVNGKKHWIRATSEQDYADKLAELFGAKQHIEKSKHDFKQYALNWFNVYSKPNVEQSTSESYLRLLKLHLIPAFDGKNIEDISTTDIQKMFNEVDGVKSTKQKIKVVLNMILEAAIDDEYIQRNPLCSNRIKITGTDVKYTPEYTVEQMQYIVRHIQDVKNLDDRMYLALQALHPMRLEEVLGLKWSDIDIQARTITICRAVTHPKRNLPVVKAPKTEASNRIIGLSNIAAHFLFPGKPDDFILGGNIPYSYQKVKRMCERIRKDISFADRITPMRFRTTVLTDIYDQTKDVKVAQAAAGHTTPAMTLKHYIKGRANVGTMAKVIDARYGREIAD